MASLTKVSVALLALVSNALADTSPITAKGSKFFTSDGEQFFIKGVAYQQDTGAGGKGVTSKGGKYVDPLSDEDKCKRDVPLLAELGTNTIRTYAIDPTADHSGCMKLLQEHGIYVISDLSSPNESINRDDPEWSTDLFKRYTDVVDELSQYPNVIGFFAGNEVSNNNTNTDASAFVKAAVRDTKKYIKDNVKRWMGVGYAANDDADIRDSIAPYFNCGDQDSAIDFWGYNIYSWCGDSNLQKSGYDTQAKFFENFSVPVFFAEYGCNNDGAANRKFTETAALYGDEMAKVFSGGIVYMYFQEANDYGLVKEVSDTQVTKLKDFDALKNQVKKADPQGVKESSYSSSNQPAKCPSMSKDWQAATELPPSPNSALCDCMVKSASCVPSKDLDVKDYGDIFGYICGKEDGKYCSGIKADAEKGIYGAYSMCSAEAKLAYVLNSYSSDSSNGDGSCDFKGQATKQDGSTASNCKDSLDSADAVNSQVATASAPVTQVTGGASGSSDDEDSFGVHSASMVTAFSFSNVAVGLYMVVAAGAGAAMVAL